MKRLIVVVLVALASAVAVAAASRAHIAFRPAAHRKPPDLVDHGWQPKPLRIVAQPRSGADFRAPRAT